MLCSPSSITVVRRSEPGEALLATALEQTITDLITETLPARRNRFYERIKRPAKNTFATKKPDHLRACSRVDYTLTVTGKQPLTSHFTK